MEGIHVHKSHTFSVTQLFFIHAKLFWSVSSQEERVTKVRSVPTAEQTAQALQNSTGFPSS